MPTLSCPPASWRNPLAAIETWWGEDLSASLVDRIVAAPHEQYVAFFQDYSMNYQERLVPELAPGRLRPILAGDLSPLLYAQEVALFNPIFQAKPLTWTFSSERLRGALTELLALAPLTRVGQVHYIDPGFDLAEVERCLSLLRESPALEFYPPDIQRELRQSLPTLLTESKAGRALIHLLGYLIHCRRHGGNLQITVSKQEYELLSLLFSAPAADHPEYRRLGSLIDLQLPSAQIPLASLVRLRTSHDLFGTCRELLSSVLREVYDIPPSAQWLREARGHVSAKLDPTVASIRRELQQLGMAGVARRSYRTLAVSAVGIASGAAIDTGGIAAPVAAGISSGLASALIDHLQGREARRESRAMLDYCMVIKDAPMAATRHEAR